MALGVRPTHHASQVDVLMLHPSVISEVICSATMFLVWDMLLNIGTEVSSPFIIVLCHYH